MTEEARLQRMEDKIDKLTEVVGDTKVLQEQVFTLQRNNDELEASVKILTKEGHTQDTRIQDLDRTLRWVKNVVIFGGLLLITALTGINVI